MLVCALCFAAALLVPSQSTPAAPPPFSAVSGAFFAVSVQDIGASTKWYTEKLGLQVILQPPGEKDAAVVVLEGGGLTVELVQLAAAAADAREPQLTHGIFKAGLVVDDLDRTLNALKARGVSIAIGPFPARDKIKSNFLIRDNAGNLIQFFGR
jgi:catechol 2,3-dioxygenase-like lactoylglutathione lyase family enzyme